MSKVNAENKDVGHLAENLPNVQFSPPERVELASLVFEDGVRYGGEDASHSRALAALEDWPPILVHAKTMVVLDGLHRVCAAKRRGERLIEVRFVNGSRADSFILAVRANTAFGKPLTLAERERSARRILVSHPHWSDRAIADACGLSGKTVGMLRTRSSGEIPHLSARIGRDGKTRPVNVAENRRLAAELIAKTPNASLRQIARESRLSPATVKDVRDRVARGESPVRSGSHPQVPESRAYEQQSLVTTQVLSDSALRSTDDGGAFTEWFASHLVAGQEWEPFVDVVPVSRIYSVVDQARACAAEWRLFAEQLETRVRGRRAS
jgi:hypothetical protein